MKIGDELRKILREHTGWGKSRLDCFIGLLLGLLRLKHINLTQLAVAFESPASVKSRYRRLQRFFREVVFDYDAFAGLIMQLFDFYGQSYYLTLDRTNWQWGEKSLNILTLGIAYQGAAIPIYWLILNKRGNSNQRERIALLQRFIRRFGRKNILGVLGDREFIGDHWWQWLTAYDIPYLIRVKDNQLVSYRNAQPCAVRSLFADLKVGESRLLRKARRIGQQRVWLSGLRLDSGEWLILASNQRFQQPLPVYARRWEIENLFQCLKGRGFHLEETRLTLYFRLKKVMALLTLAFCWAHKAGEWQHRVVKPLKIKKHGRYEQSLFRYGLDYLTNTLLHGIQNINNVFWMLVLFLCPPDMIRDSPPSSNVIVLIP
jgi:hypothetical protein